MPEPTATAPLAGVRVLDIATFVAAPYCATILSEFGAEVIKVEEPRAGDPFRRFGTPTERADSTLAWLSEARNKASITLNLRSDEGAALFKVSPPSPTSSARTSGLGRWRNGGSAGRTFRR